MTITFKDDKDGSTKTVQAPLGKSILEVAHENDVELEGAHRSAAQHSAWPWRPLPACLCSGYAGGAGTRALQAVALAGLPAGARARLC